MGIVKWFTYSGIDGNTLRKTTTTVSEDISTLLYRMCEALNMPSSGLAIVREYANGSVLDLFRGLAVGEPRDEDRDQLTQLSKLLDDFVADIGDEGYLILRDNHSTLIYARTTNGVLAGAYYNRKSKKSTLSMASLETIFSYAIADFMNNDVTLHEAVRAMRSDPEPRHPDWAENNKVVIRDHLSTQTNT
ncbi:hypothetical protein FWD07_03175 [Candidatus Saccharibacteria bacterium]|nr:hypothetical protein [Candidatus Saccharibacteria bacterium]